MQYRRETCVVHCEKKMSHLLKPLVNVTEFNAAVCPWKISLGCQNMATQEETGKRFLWDFTLNRLLLATCRIKRFLFQFVLCWPDRLWTPHPWKFSRPSWIGLWTIWSSGRLPAHGMVFRHRWSLMFLPTQIVLWFYDSGTLQAVCEDWAPRGLSNEAAASFTV